MRIFIDKRAVEENAVALSEGWDARRPLKPVIVCRDDESGREWRGSRLNLHSPLGLERLVAQIIYDPKKGVGGNAAVWIEVAKGSVVEIDGTTLEVRT